MPGATSANYDVTGDGQHFLMVKDLDQDAVSTRIVVVLNFAEELKRLTAAAKVQMTGQTISHCRLLGRLGEDGMGRV